MIKENFGFQAAAGCRVAGEYFSRRNRVFRVSPGLSGKRPGLLVVKEHAAACRAESEYNRLLALSAAGIAVPLPLALDGRLLYLQHLEGILLTEVIENNLAPQSAWTESLARWYRTLHESTAAANGSAILKTDNNLRNFLYRDGALYGLDFEESSRGDPAIDIGQICAFILADRPAFTPGKITAAAELARRYLDLNAPVTVERIEREMLRELERMALRRREERGEIRQFIDSITGSGTALFPG